MWKWIGRAVLLGVVGLVGWGVYGYFRVGLHTRPEMPPGAFWFIYESGLRAILVDVPDERETRRYLGYPADVPFYIEDTWTFCSPPEGQEIAEAERWLNESDPRGRPPGMRVEAICRIDADGEIVIRGIITSVPRL